MDKGLKVEFHSYQEMYIPEALMGKFYELMRGAVITKREYSPGQPSGEYERVNVEGTPPNLAFADEPEDVISLKAYEKLQKEARAAKEEEDELDEMTNEDS